MAVALHHAIEAQVVLENVGAGDEVVLAVGCAEEEPADLVGVAGVGAAAGAEDEVREREVPDDESREVRVLELAELGQCSVFHPPVAEHADEVVRELAGGLVVEAPGMGAAGLGRDVLAAVGELGRGGVGAAGSGGDEEEEDRAHHSIEDPLRNCRARRER